jgi:hypothetical protein
VLVDNKGQALACMRSLEKRLNKQNSCRNLMKYFRRL